MGVNSKAKISIGKSSIFEICKIIEKLGYDFDFKDCETIDLVKSGYVVLKRPDLYNIFCCESTFEDLCLISTSDENHYNLLKEIVSYIGGKVTRNDCDENSWVYVEKTNSLCSNTYDKESSIYRALKDCFSIKEIEKIIDNCDLLKDIL